MKVSFNPITSCKINFGTTEHVSRINVDNKIQNFVHNDYFIRYNESSPKEVAKFLIEEAEKADNVEMKIWGCSDLSKYLTRTLAMQQQIGVRKHRELFNDIELTDINPDLINRDKLGIVGAAPVDFENLDSLFNIKSKELFKKVPDNRDYFLENEPKSCYMASLKQLEHDYFQRCAKEESIEYYKIPNTLLQNTRIRVGDIRKDIKKMQLNKEGTLRIFEFANAWHLLEKPNQVELAADIVKKTNPGDILIVGSTELGNRLDMLLETVGFDRHPVLDEIFIRREDKEDSWSNTYC